MMEDDRPWYRQFWPWVLIGLPGSVVIASFITLYIAIKHDDSVVHDDYYKEGLAINRELSQDRFASERDMSAALSYDEDTQRIDLKLADPSAAELLLLDFTHPNTSDLDMSVQLHALGNGMYTGRLPRPADASPRWYLQLRDSTAKQSPWRLRGTLYTERDIISATLNAD